MAPKDPKAARAMIHYQGGHVQGALGLLDYLFTTPANPPVAQISVDRRGRRRLKNTLRSAAAIGGKQLVIHLKNGDKYQIHYSGALVDWRLAGVPLLDRGVVKSWSTARGTAQAVN